MSELARRPGKIVVPEDLRADVSTHSFWKWGTTSIFDIIIVNLDTGSYLHMTPKKDIAKAEKDNKDLYLQVFLERRCSFTAIVYSAYRIPGVEDLAAQKRLSTLLSCNLKQEYFELCGFLRKRMSLAIVRSNSLLLHGPQEKDARIWQRPEMLDGAVMALLVPWKE